MARPQQIRRSYNRVTQVSLGEEALEARAQWLAATRSPRGWLAAFVAERCQVEDTMCEAAKAARREVRSAVRAATLGTVRTTGVQGTAHKCWRRNVSARNRLRRAGAGRPVLAPEVGEELWSWFVDRLHNVPARVNSNLLLTQARIFVSDVQECWRRRAEFGEADPDKPPRLPIIDQNWITRWRRAHGVTWRTVNLRYKISAAKRNLRVRAFWTNVLRLRLFHAALFGENKLRFVGFDQKPLYFNSSVAAKTLALRGCRKVALKENVAASRERFTVMTQVHSWTPTEPPPCAVMFRVQSVVGGRIRARLKVPGDWLLQFGPKGSYRTEHVLRFLDWWCEPVGRPADTIVVVLDWFKPHLDERVDELVHESGHTVLRIGGGITPDVQVGDTHRHGPYTRVYRDLEAEDAQAQLQLRPSHLPNCSRQTVMDRAYEAWTEVRHTDSEKEWVQNAITNALDGSQDGDLRSDLQSLWHALRMPVIRDQIRAEITSDVAAGRLHSWSQYPELLEPYDEHVPHEEGWEDAVVEIGEDETGDVDSPCDADHDDTPREIREEELAAQDSDDAEGDHMKALDANAALIVSMETSVDEKRATEIITADVEAQARKDLKQEIGGARLQALAEAAELLNKNGEVAVAEQLEKQTAWSAEKTH